MRLALLIRAALAGASVAAAWDSHVELVRRVEAIDDARAHRECRDSLARARARLEALDKPLKFVSDGRAKRGVGGGP